jgi:flagellar biosynthesis protein FlhG
LDLGAGTSAHTLDFFLSADVGLVVVVPEPTAIENVYRFIKSAYYRRLMLAPTLDSMKDLIDMAMDPKNSKGIKTPADLFREAQRLGPDYAIKLKAEIAKFRPRILMNQVRTQSDIDVGFSIVTVCKKYFGIDAEFVGHIDYDSSVWQAVRRKRPLYLEYPNSRLVSNLDRIVQLIIKEETDERAELVF